MVDVLYWINMMVLGYFLGINIIYIFLIGVSYIHIQK